VRHDDLPPWLGQVCRKFVTFDHPHERAGGDTNDAVLAAGAVAAFPLAMSSPPRPQVPLELEVKQGGETPVDEKHDVAAISPVSTVGMTVPAVLLTQEADAAPAPITGLHRDLDLIDKLHKSQQKRITALDKQRHYGSGSSSSAVTS
jgi:hypothetical protein